VNDGVCDYELCCDGTDEWEGVGGIVCENRCKEIGKEWRKQDEQRKRALGAAGKRRKELASEAARLRKEVEDRIKSLDTQIEASQLKAHGLETELAEVERKEKVKWFEGRRKGTRSMSWLVWQKGG
jgi:protein kinase C substrate 80K-H